MSEAGVMQGAFCLWPTIEETKSDTRLPKRDQIKALILSGVNPSAIVSFQMETLFLFIPLAFHIKASALPNHFS